MVPRAKAAVDIKRRTKSLGAHHRTRPMPNVAFVARKEAGDLQDSSRGRRGANPVRDQSVTSTVPLARVKTCVGAEGQCGIRRWGRFELRHRCDAGQGKSGGLVRLFETMKAFHELCWSELFL
jgi:hypothetical protein